MSGLIFFLAKRFHTLTMKIPDAILRAKAKNPPATIPNVWKLIKASTVIVAPTQSPRKMVAAFITPFDAASNKREVSLPISLTKLPNISIPTKLTADGTKIATMVVTAMGKIILSTRIFLITVPSGYRRSCSFILMRSSFSEHNSFTTNGIITGTNAI